MAAAAAATIWKLDDQLIGHHKIIYNAHPCMPVLWSFTQHSCVPAWLFISLSSTYEIVGTGEFPRKEESFANDENEAKKKNAKTKDFRLT